MFLSVSKLNAHHNGNNAIPFSEDASKVTGVLKLIYHFLALIIKR